MVDNYFFPAKTMIVLVGLPGSGKSTWIKENKHRFLNKGYILSTDNMIEDFAASIDKTYDDVFNDYIKEANKEFHKNRIPEAMKSGESIVVDRTNMNRKARKKFLDAVPDDYFKMAIVFEVDNDVLKERLEKRSKEEGKTIPSNVIESMRNSFELPSLDEGFDSVSYYCGNCNYI